MFEPLAKKARYNEVVSNYALCILCQRKSNEELVDNPQSHTKVLAFVKERASYNDSIYPDIWDRLKDVSPDILKSNSASWHRTCYQNTVHAGNYYYRASYYFVL